jgi:hypothetical protein
MNSEIYLLTEHLDKNPRSDPSVSDEIIFRLGFMLPPDYVEFMREFNGGEGLIGDRNYLEIWKIEDLFPRNEKYEVDKFAQGYFVFASNAGGTAYAFSRKASSIVSFEFVGMLIADEPIVLGQNFLEFLRYLYSA